MRVFRCISARKITNLYQGIEDDRQALVKGRNTHDYIDGISYIHFFRYSDDCQYYFKQNQFNMSNLDHYVMYMVANVPNEILRKYFGYGIYSYTDEEKIFQGDYIPLPEYAIPISEFKKEYIVQVNNFIPYEYLNSEEHNQYLQIVRELLDKYDNHFTVTRYLKEQDLESLLGVVDDDRTEDEIIEDKIKELCKVWKGYD